MSPPPAKAAAPSLRPATARPGANAVTAVRPASPAGARGNAAMLAMAQRAPAGAAPGMGNAAATQARRGAAQDPAFQRVKHKVQVAGGANRAHAPAGAKAAQAQGAAVSPPAEMRGLAADKHVQTMDAQQPRPFSREKFKAALLGKIRDTAPKTLGETAKFKEEGKLAGAKAELHGTVQDGKKDSAGPVVDAAAKAPDPSGIPPRPVTPLPGPEASPPPPDVGAAQAVPMQRPDSEVSLKSGPAALDQQMSSANVSDEQLKKSNEPAFQSALGAKQQAAAQSAAAPTALRKDETAVLIAARTGAGAAAAAQLGAMHGVRGKGLSASQALQAATKAADEAKRTEVSAKILGFYDKAKTNVEARLKKLDEDVDKSFDDGATAAQKAFEDYVDKRMTDYKINRYLLTVGGSLLWIKDQVLNLPDEVNAFYEEGRGQYIARMDHVLDGVAAIVETGLGEAKAEIAQARGAIAAFVAGLDPALQEVGHKAAADIGKKLDELDQGVTDKQTELIDGLAQKYNDALQKVDDRIGEMKAANKGLVDQARDAVAGAIDTIIKLKAMLLGVLARAANAIDLVIKDPIKFLGNLVAAVKLGVQNFASRIGEHLKQGFMEWLFGAIAEAGIQLPKTFDLKGILSLVLQVLGLTYANIRARAVAILGDKVVAALETGAEIFKKLITEGPGALWEWIKEKVGDLKAMVIDQIKSFIVEKVIVAGITWIIGLLNPASAFVKACKAIYDIIMFFVERGAQILALVNAVIDSVTAIALGQIGGAAKWVETALARAIPVVIGFLAGLLGLGGISDKIKSVVEKIRKPINTAIDWVIHKAVALVKAAGKFVAGLFGGKEKKADKNPHANDPEKGPKVEAGLTALRQGEAARRVDGAVSHEDALSIAAKVKYDHAVFTSVTVKDGGGSWDYEYAASASTKVPGDKKPIFENSEQIHRMVYDIAVERFAKARERSAHSQAVSSGGAQQIAGVAAKEDPLILGAQIADRRTLSRADAPTGRPLEMNVGGEPVQARQGWGGANIVISDLGTYPEIGKLLKQKGLSGPPLAAAVEKFRRTGQGDPLVRQYVALTFGAEPGRQVIASVHAELHLGASAQGVSAHRLFGEGGISPIAPVGYSGTERRLAAMRDGGAAPREGTKIGARVEETLQRTVLLVYNAVKGRPFKDVIGLRTAILQLLDQMDVAKGVG